MINQLGKFYPNLSNSSKSLRDFLCTNNQWCLGISQQKCFDDLKEKLNLKCLLTLSEHNHIHTVSSDVSSYEFSGLLCQRQPDNMLKPIAYVSRSLAPTKQCYAQIEKEALVVTRAHE